MGLRLGENAEPANSRRHRDSINELLLFKVPAETLDALASVLQRRSGRCI